MTDAHHNLTRRCFQAVAVTWCAASVFAPRLLVADSLVEKPTPEEVVEAGRQAVVVITSLDGLGSGFVVHKDGVIVTNFHVIGQGRPFKIQRADGQSLTPTAILAYDRRNDLALIQVEERGLPALELADSDAVRLGQPVVAVGHPLGLRNRVARGVVAEKRAVNGYTMIQVAMPIEQGNSGGPLLDEAGRVIGVIAIKSAGCCNKRQ